MRTTVKITAFSFVLLMCGLAGAFTLNSTDPGQTGWPSNTVTFKLNGMNCPANIGDLLNAATGIWNSIQTSGLFVKVEGTSTTTPAMLIAGTASDAPVIACDLNFGSSFGVNANQVLGVGFIGNQTQPINYGGLVLNVQVGANANISNVPNYIAQIATAHEIGHALGLGHSSDINALMYYDTSSKKRLTLAQDDMDGISYLYPRNELNPSAIMGCGLTKNTNSWGSIPRDMAFLMLPLVLIWGLRKIRLPARYQPR